MPQNNFDAHYIHIKANTQRNSAMHTVAGPGHISKEGAQDNAADRESF